MESVVPSVTTSNDLSETCAMPAMPRAPASTSITSPIRTNVINPARSELLKSSDGVPHQGHPFKLICPAIQASIFASIRLNGSVHDSSPSHAFRWFDSTSGHHFFYSILPHFSQYPSTLLWFTLSLYSDSITINLPLV